MKYMLTIALLLCFFPCSLMAQMDTSKIEPAIHVSDTLLMDSAASLCTSTLKASVNQPVALQAKGFFSALLDTQNWPARWQCGEWTPFHGWLYIGSDLLIWLAYFAIPAILAVFIYKRKSTVPFKSIFFLFIGFILACGLTHFIDAVIFWWPAYRLSAVIRLLTAFVSLGTVFALIKVMPKALELKSPDALENIIQERTKELTEANQKLENEIIHRQKAEKEIIRLNKSLSAFQQAIYASSIVSVADRKGNITYVNENFEKISEYPKEELLGQNHRIINSGYHERSFWINMWKTISKGQTWREEVKNKTKTGNYYWVDTFIMPFLDEAGRVKEYLSIRNDITQRKKVEFELKELNEELEEKVKGRTEKLEVLNKELESFSYSVSHDLRAPLRSIAGYAQILQEDYARQLDEEGNKTLQTIIRNAGKMGQLIDDLLEFSRLRQKGIEKRKADMNLMAESVVQELKAQEQDRAVNIQIHPLEEAFVDIQMIRHVWVNLISNALKYTRKTEAAEIEIGSKTTAGETCFFVRDNGVGFNMNYVNKLFNVFQRLHRAEEFEGTGVGLALVKRIVDRHGGKIWAEAQENKGATFYFTIPK